MPTGWSMPPPTPWSTRARTSQAMDPAAAQQPDPKVNMAMANRITRLAPKRSPIQPDTGIHIARLSM